MFKIGDRVRQSGYSNVCEGWIGTIVSVPNPSAVWCYTKHYYGVEFDNSSNTLHTCSGKSKDCHGLFVPAKNLELIKSASVEKIVITHDGKTTLARLYENDKVVKSAEAKCSPDDEFNFKEGAKLAFERLTEEMEEPPKFDKSMLTNGRFGYMSVNDWFVVVDDKIIYKNGALDFLEKMNSKGRYRSGYGVKYIVEALSFDNAKLDPKKVIWCDSGFDPKKVK